jgi:hypothetical protein
MADLGGAQISALLESVPGIVNVLRSPVADAIVNTIRASAGVSPFDCADAEELLQFAVRRGLIGSAEGEQVLEDVRRAGKGGRGAGRASRTTRAAQKTVAKVAKKTAAPTKAAKKAVGQKPVKKTSTAKRGAKAVKRSVKRR